MLEFAQALYGLSVEGQAGPGLVEWALLLAMARRRTDVQRRFEAGALALPDARPATLDERAWMVLLRHVRDGAPYAALAREWQVSQGTVQQLAARAAAALRYPDLADLPGAVRHVLVAGGYTTREAIARAGDAELLRLRRMRTARLQAVRAVIPRAG